MALKVDLKLTPEAASHLDQAGRLVSGLIERMVRDEALMPHSSKPLEGKPEWRSFDLGSYRTVFGKADQGDDKVAYIAAIDRADKLDDRKAIELVRTFEERHPELTPDADDTDSA